MKRIINKVSSGLRHPRDIAVDHPEHRESWLTPYTLAILRTGIPEDLYEIKTGIPADVYEFDRRKR